MARKSKMQMIIDAAIADASPVILKNTISSMGKNTTVLELVGAIKGTQLADSFHAMTLADLAESIQASAAQPARRGPGRPPKAASAGRAKKAAAKVGGQINTRTAEGRAELDAVIAAVLKSASEGLRSEAINTQVPADTAQIRQSLKRMIHEGQVSVTGQKRASTYSWGGKSESAKGRSPRRKKAAAKKRTAKKRAAKKRVTKA